GTIVLVRSETLMARTKDHSNGQLEEVIRDMFKAHVALAQAQATLTQTQAATLAEMDRLRRETAERFARIENILLDHSRILAQHTRILQALPDAVRQRMGFRPGE